MEKKILSRDFRNILILASLVLVIGIFLIAATVVIARDGTVFIEYARQIAVSPSETMVREYQHPGYPMLIFAASKVTGLIYKGRQLFCFIYAAQAAALLFRLFTIVVLYYLAKEIVGNKFAFWAMFILVLLPKPAEFGSDALSDWPALFFLAAGMLSLLYGAKYRIWWMFAIAGLAAGLGYLIRPEGAQIVIYGVWWLALQLLWKKRTMSKSGAYLAFAAMIIAFIITAGPYMKLKGAIFPKKGVGEFSSSVQAGGNDDPQIFVSDTFIAALVPSEMIRAFGTMFKNIGDTLMWFFLLPYLLGVFLHFRKHKLLEPEQFFIIALIIINVPLMIWLCSSYGYMSVRHTLPLVVFTMFYVPEGLQALATMLNVKFSRGYQHTHRDSTELAEVWFAILMVIGIVICIPNLLNALHSDKKEFRQAADWLIQNTPDSATIGVPDYRINFYAERKGIRFEDAGIPEAVEYLVVDSKNSEKISPNINQFLKVFTIPACREPQGRASGNSKKAIDIYKRRSD